MKGPTEGRGLRVAVTVALAAALVGVVYAPWVPRPFDTIDFAEFLAFLRSDEGLPTRVGRFVGFYVEHHGRFNLAGYAGLFLKWELFGAHPMAWHWARIAQMSLLVALVYLLARRLAIAPIGALAAAALFIVARPSGEGWIRLTLGEPLGLLAMLGALLLATGWREDPSSRRAWGIALAVAVAILAKEMLAGLVPLVHLIAVARTPSGRLAAPTRMAGDRRLTAAIWLPAVLTFGAAAAVALTATGDGFTTLYGVDPISIDGFLLLLGRPWQLQAVAPGLPWWLLPANALCLVAIALGVWWTERQGGEERTHLRWMMVVAIGTALAHAILYLPWPWAYYYYAMPFLLGPALLLGTALTGLRTAPRAVAGSAWAAAGAALVVASAATATEARRTVAIQQVNGALLDALAVRAGADSIFLMRPGSGGYGWIGAAPSLRNFALASGMAERMPPAEDRPCDALGGALAPGQGRLVIVSYLSGCGAFPFPPSVAIRDTVRSIVIGWQGVRPVREILGADLLEVGGTAAEGRP